MVLIFFIHAAKLEHCRFPSQKPHGNREGIDAALFAEYSYYKEKHYLHFGGH